MVFPWFSGRLASWMAAHRAAPEEIPTRIPSLRPILRVVAVEPKDSPVLSGGRPGPHQLQGIGAGFVPKALDTSVYDEVIAVSDEDAFAVGRRMGRTMPLAPSVSASSAP